MGGSRTRREENEEMSFNFFPTSEASQKSQDLGQQLAMGLSHLHSFGMLWLGRQQEGSLF